MFILQEFIDVILMTLGVGYIFMDIMRRPVIEDYDPLNPKLNKRNDLAFACLVTAPAVILHELMHKLVALAFGLEATFHAAYGWLVLGMILKAVGSGFVFFVPGYVAISGLATHLQSAFIAFAGPGTNGALYLLASFMLKQKQKSPNHVFFWALTKRINGFLFLFNMIPFAFFDGYKVFEGLYLAFFG